MTKVACIGGVYRTCFVCGKSFYVANPEGWAYRRGCKGGVRVMCSYSCMRAYDRKRQKKPRVLEVEE